MKKLVIFAAALAAASTLMAQTTNQVLSRNAVGYEAFQINTSELVFVRYDFNYMGPGVCTVSNLIGNQLPLNSSISIWDPVNQIFNFENKTRGGWTPNTNIITCGTAFFMKAGATNTTVYLMGEVPDAYTQPVKTSAVYGAAGGALGSYAYAYPVGIAFTTTIFAANAALNDSLSVWDQATQSYQFWNRLRSGWSPSVSNVTIAPGQAFFYKTTNTTPWVMTKPYTWP